MIFLLIAAALVVGAPLVAAVLVSVASIHEDAAKSLAGRPPGLLAAAARRLLQARVGGAGPLQRSPRPVKSATGVRQAGRPERATQAGRPERATRAGRPERATQAGRPERATQTGPIPAPRRVADDESGTRSYGALATPRG
jgi:hypothetical protein